MKKKNFLQGGVFFLILIFITQISAISVEMDSGFDKGEMLSAKISGNFIQPPTEKDVEIYKGHTKTASNIDLNKFSEDYYISSPLINKEQGKYSLRIKNVKYKQGLETLEKDIISNFTISNKTADFGLIRDLLLLEKNFQ